MVQKEHCLRILCSKTKFPDRGLCLILTLTLSAKVFAIEIIGDLVYWESNVNHISSFMNIVPDIYSSTLGTYNLTTLKSQVSNSKNQWNTAGISCNITTLKGNAEITVYGGSLSEIQSVQPSFLSTYAGLTLNGTVQQPGVFVYNGIYKYYYKINEATVYVRSGLSYPQNVVAHELGHSLGWGGHITTSGNVMYGTESACETLTTRDKRHLSQIH